MVSSSFNSSFDGWTVTNGTGEFIATGGAPGGNLRASEGGSGVYYYDAPAAYLGAKTDFYGGTLTFDLKQDGDSSQFDEADVLLTGGGLTLALDVGENPGIDWTSYSATLALGAGWKVGSVTGRVATAEEILSTLSDLESLRIRGEYVDGSTNDASNLDNVSMVKGTTPPTVVPGPVVKSTFNTDVDGWSFIADVKEFRWQATGGQPGGWLEAVDYATGAVWYFVAPEKFLGDKAPFLKGTLSFDLKQSSLSSQFDERDVVLTGGGTTLVYNTDSNPGLDWTSYTIRLAPGDNWTLDTVGGEAATLADFKTVLGDFTALQIRGEYVSGPDTGGLDNVKLKAPDGAVFDSLNVYDGPVSLLGLSTHEQLSAALAVAAAGNAIGTLDSANTPDAAYDVDVNRLTMISDASLGTTFRLDGVKHMTLSGANNMNITGNALNNDLTGSDGNNTLRGGSGRDNLIGRDGRDTLYGDKGNDALSGGRGNDKLYGGDGKDVVHGGADIDTLVGGKGNDALYGGGGNDSLDGQAGNDVLLGGYGGDMLKGGGGDDYLNGNAGKDTLIFKGTFGRDVVQFEDGFDTLRLVKGNGEAGSVAEFKAASEDLGGMVIYDKGGDDKNVIVLLDTALSDLTSADFDFV